MAPTPFQNLLATGCAPVAFYDEKDPFFCLTVIMVINIGSK